MHCSRKKGTASDVLLTSRVTARRSIATSTPKNGSGALEYTVASMSANFKKERENDRSWGRRLKRKKKGGTRTDPRETQKSTRPRPSDCHQRATNLGALELVCYLEPVRPSRGSRVGAKDRSRPTDRLSAHTSVRADLSGKLCPLARQELHL